MKDREIAALFREHSERAIPELLRAYGPAVPGMSAGEAVVTESAPGLTVRYPVTVTGRGL